ncbi:uncharacterized protein LOC117805823 [Xyrichtys novacula]|uniref:Uncharacterized protein LOC117805823 n=1 Tax=Xyrichtys novacula TaxID=13765 RepID=A0AAV1GMY9_XYRNO|nr:uncharacterized protein LOC117805823 [Xyrichtys novacula]
MKKLFSKRGRTSISRTPLIERDNSSQQGYDLALDANDNHPSILNTNEEQPLEVPGEISLQVLAEVLGVVPDTNTTLDGVWSDSDQQKSLIQKSVDQHFPKPPADLDGDLPEHLKNVQNTVHSELARLHLLLDGMVLGECLIDCYHRHTFNHLDDLLQEICSSKSLLVLMKWVLYTYPSQDLLSHPGREEPVTKVDPLMFSEWFVKAKDKLLVNVQKEVKGQLEKILQFEQNEDGMYTDEAFVGFYVDVIGCTEAIPKETLKISSELSHRVQEVCFRALLGFLDRYMAEQTETLGKEAKKEKPKMWLFFKTLNTCEKLRGYVQNKGSAIQRSLLEHIVAKLDNIESLALNLLLEKVADIAEKNLKDYFKTDNKRFLMSALTDDFSKTQCSQEIEKKVMDEVYELVVRIYLKHLLKSSKSRLQRCWSSDVGRTIHEDADLLHSTFTKLAPGVQQWNFVLLRVSELLECKDVDMVKLTVAVMQKESPSWRGDVELLPKLLRWVGLSGSRVREVLDAIPGQEPRHVSWCFSLKCW